MPVAQGCFVSSLAEIGLVWSVGSREEVHLTMTKTTDIKQILIRKAQASLQKTKLTFYLIWQLILKQRRIETTILILSKIFVRFQYSFFWGGGVEGGMFWFVFIIHLFH